MASNLRSVILKGPQAGFTIQEKPMTPCRSEESYTQLLANKNGTYNHEGGSDIIITLPQLRHVLKLQLDIGLFGKLSMGSYLLKFNENLCRYVKDSSEQNGINDLCCMVNAAWKPLTCTL